VPGAIASRNPDVGSAEGASLPCFAQTKEPLLPGVIVREIAVSYAGHQLEAAKAVGAPRRFHLLIDYCEVAMGLSVPRARLWVKRHKVLCLQHVT
jgi:hypothetical protein